MSKQKTIEEEARRSEGYLQNFLPSPPTPSFYFSSSDSAFAQLNLLLYEPHQKKHNEKRQLRRLIKLILGRFLQVYYCAHIIGLRFFSVTNLLNTSVLNFSTLSFMVNFCGKSKILVVSKLISCTTYRKVNETKIE